MKQKKDAYNREKGIRRLEKAYKHGPLTKGNINKRGYNKFLSMDGEVKVTINYDRIADDSKWDGLKGYLTNTDIPIQDVYTCLLYTSPSPRDRQKSRMPSSA